MQSVSTGCTLPTTAAECLLKCCAGEFGNPNPPQCQKGYQGVALTLIDSLSTLAVMGNKTEFEKGVWFVAEEVRSADYCSELFPPQLVLDTQCTMCFHRSSSFVYAHHTITGPSVCSISVPKVLPLGQSVTGCTLYCQQACYSTVVPASAPLFQCLQNTLQCHTGTHITSLPIITDGEGAAQACSACCRSLLTLISR